MEEMKNHGKKWFYWFLLGVAIIAVYKVLDCFPDVIGGINGFLKIISPFFAGIFIAYLLYIPCKKIESFYKKSKMKFVKRKSRTLSILTVYIIAILLLLLILDFILPVLIESTTELIANLQGYVESAMNEYQKLPNDSIFKSDVVYSVFDSIKNIDIKQYINLNNITEYAKGAIDVIAGVVSLFVAFIVSIYILAERDTIYEFGKKSAKALLKTKTYNYFAKYFKSANNIFLGFISSQLLDAVVVGILTTIVMSIMGVKYAPLLGFIIGLFNVIPYVGAIIAIIIAGIITLITGGVSQAIWMIIIVTIVQQIDANIINPKIVGKSLKVSPILVILAVTIGGAYWGMIGIFLAVPISALIKIIAEDYIDFKVKEGRP